MFRSPTRWHLPFEPYSPVQGWMATTGWNAVHSPVSFDCPGQARQGVPMRDLRLKGTSTPIRGANDAVLAHMGLQPHVFRIIWPGYRQAGWCREVPVASPNGVPITRVALGVQIAPKFVRLRFSLDNQETNRGSYQVKPSLCGLPETWVRILPEALRN
ncbi:hypothetical protein B0H13DRAFT_1891174 [Mycena leptocephala]|nr:hypothetical protein B0H13DRAFT_1891174 [Mycena leptocephala]